MICSRCFRGHEAPMASANNKKTMHKAEQITTRTMKAPWSHGQVNRGLSNGPLREVARPPVQNSVQHVALTSVGGTGPCSELGHTQGPPSKEPSTERKEQAEWRSLVTLLQPGHQGRHCRVGSADHLCPGTVGGKWCLPSPNNQPWSHCQKHIRCWTSEDNP